MYARQLFCCEANGLEGRSHGEGVSGSIRDGFGPGGRDVADGLDETAFFEPAHPFEGGSCDGRDGTP